MLKRILLGLLVFSQITFAQRGNTLSGGGDTHATSYVVDASNGFSPSFETTSFTNIPVSWRNAAIAVLINDGATTGAALRALTHLNNKTGYTQRFDFYLAAENIAEGAFCTIAVGKEVNNSVSFSDGSVDLAYTIRIRRSSGQRKLEVIIPTVSGDEGFQWSGTVGLQTPITIDNTYNIRDQNHLVTIAGETVLDRDFDAAAIQSIGTLILGSSGESTCRGVTYFIGRVLESPVTPAPFVIPPPAVLPGLPVISQDSPATGATNVPIVGQSLGCSSTGALTYRLFFDVVNPPVAEKTLTNTTACGYVLPQLANATTYYWRVQATNASGTTTGTVWSFTTVAVPTNGDLDLVAGRSSCADANDNSPTGRNPKLLWSCAQQEVFNQMVDDYEAVGCSSAQGVTCSATPTTLGGKWFKTAKGYCDRAGTVATGDYGQWNVLCYQMTGDARYITDATTGAWFKINTRWIANAPPRDPNYSRVVNGMHALNIEWAWPALNDAQRTAYVSELDQDNDHGLLVYMADAPRWTDFDQLVGQWYFPVAMMKIILPNNVSNNALYNKSYFGGLTTTNCANPRTTMRNAICFYFTNIMAGGEFVEGPLYAKETMAWTLAMAKAVSDAVGSDQFPEITAWLPDFTNQTIANYTPDLKKQVQWSDEQDPDQLITSHVGNLLRVLAGVQQGTTAGEKAHQLLLDMHTANDLTPNALKWWGSFVYNPYAAVADYKTTKYLYTSGMGTMYLRSGWSASDSLFFTHCGNRYKDATIGAFPFDHEVSYHCMWNWYKAGEWVVHTVSSYAGAASSGEATNTMRFNGFNSSTDYKKVRATSLADTHAYISSTTGGTNVFGGFFGAPPVNLNEATRDILYVPSIDTVITYDRANVDDIANDSTDLQKYVYIDCQPPGGRLYITQMHAKQEYVFHTPTAPTFASTSYTWTTPTTKQTMRWTPLAPTSQTRTVYDLATTFAQNLATNARCGWYSSAILGYNSNGQLVFPWYIGDGGGYDRKVVKIWPSSMSTFHTYLNTFQAGSSTTAPTRISNSNAECTHVVTSGQNDVLACFNSAASSAVNNTAFHPSLAAALDGVRYHAAGSFTVAYTASATTTEVYLAHLNPALSWTYNVDGSGAVAINGAGLTSTGGFVRLSLSLAAGAHSIVVTGS